MTTRWVGRLVLGVAVVAAASVTFIPSAAASARPVGQFESAVFNQASGNIDITGWAYDPNFHQPYAQVVITDSALGRNGYTMDTTTYRADVDKKLHLRGGTLGLTEAFSPRVGTKNAVTLGAHHVCVSVLDLDAFHEVGPELSLGCRNVLVRSIAGTLQTARFQTRSVLLSGWALDKTWSQNSSDNWSPATIKMKYVDSGPKGTYTYNGVADRPAQLPTSLSDGFSGHHGFSATIPLTGAGNHRICVIETGSRHTRTGTVIWCIEKTMT